MIKPGRTWALFAAVLAFAPLPAKATAGSAITFEVLREGTPIGRHRVAFQQKAERLVVEIAIDLEVKFAFFTLFRYQHRNREVWQDGRLIAIDTQTDDDGQAFWVRGRATDQGFAVESSEGSLMAPATVIPTSYWNPATVEQTQLLDSQRGRLMAVRTSKVGAEPDAQSESEGPLHRYRMAGDLELDLWYTLAGDWARIAFQARGAEVNYRRRNDTEEAAGTRQAAHQP